MSTAACILARRRNMIRMSIVIIGATRGIGAALADALDRPGRAVTRIGRGITPGFDLLDEASIARAAGAAGLGLRLVIDAPAFCIMTGSSPRKACASLTPRTSRTASQSTRPGRRW